MDAQVARLVAVRCAPAAISRRARLAQASRRSGERSSQELAFQLTDAQFSVIAVATPGKPGVVIDRIAYSPYGEATRTLRSDVNGDGFVNQSDYTGIIRPRNGAAIGTATYVVEADLDRNGVINQLDYDISIADDGKSSSGGVGEAGLFSRGVRNSIGYCGYVYNEDSGLYTVRFRTYSPTLGRWLERDPLGYVDGIGLYQYVRGGAVMAVDPWGLQATPPDWDHELDNDAYGVPMFLENFSPWGPKLPVWILPEEQMEILMRKYSQQHVAGMKSWVKRRLEKRLLGNASAACDFMKKVVPGGVPGFDGDMELEFPILGKGAIDRQAEHWSSPLWGHVFGEPGAWTMVLNNWTYEASAKCRVSVKVTCCGDGKVRIRGSASCELNYLLKDMFENPLDIGGPFAPGNNLGGHPYPIVGDWKHRFEFEFADGPADCGCVDRNNSPLPMPAPKPPPPTSPLRRR
jgi:RHS repeat-associated protein